jgi:butyrate kinase
MEPLILVINPGASSSKVALYRGDKEEATETLYHDDSITKLPTNEQYKPRLLAVEKFLAANKVKLEQLSAVVGRGGAFKPLAGGTYEISQHLLDDILAGKVAADHVSNLGSLMAHEIAQKAGKPAYFADPVSVDEFIPEARLSGLPELPRVSLLHALNIRAVAHRAADELSKSFDKFSGVVVHLGSGISVAAIRKGRIIDVNNANDGGPFSPERAGTLPTTGLIKLCFSGKYDEKSMIKRATKEGGFLAYLGENDMRKISERADKGDKDCQAVLDAFVYQVVKEIGAYAAALEGDFDCIILTGAGARPPYFVVEEIEKRVAWMGKPVKRYPGEGEMEALASAALRVLAGKEKAKEYK